MNIISLEAPLGAKIYTAPKTKCEEPFYIPEYGTTSKDLPCYQLRLKSHIGCAQYVISGSGILICNNKFYYVNSGDTFILPQGSDQIYYSNPDNHFARIWINFKGVFAEKIMEIYKTDNCYVYKNTNSLSIFEEIHDICSKETDPVEYQNKSAAAFLKLIQFLSQHKTEANDDEPDSDKIKLYIERHITENIKLEDLGKHFNFSTEHIIRTFKKKYGITPHQYILQSKIRIAMIMLMTTEYSIEEISDKLSFSDPHHFSYQFFKHVGFRPSAYRNMNKKEK